MNSKQRCGRDGGPERSALAIAKFCLACGAILFTGAGRLAGANIIRYDDRAALNADTSARTVTDFDTVRNGCVGIFDAGGLTVNNINFAGGVARSLSSAPCSGPLIPWQGYVLVTRLVIRADAPAMAAAIVSLPAGVMAVGFDVGISSDPVTSRVEVTVVTSDGKEQTFSVAGKGTGIGGTRRVTPVFAGFTSSRAIKSVRFKIPEIVDSNLILDDFTIGQTAPPVITTSSGVLNGASFQPVVASNTWVTIFGRLLSGGSRAWGQDDFSGTRLPTSVDDVTVTMNGQPAYVYFVSPGQVNVLTPVDLGEGPVIVQVSRGDLRSSPVTVQAQRLAPGLFLFDPENRRYAIATHADGSLVGKTSLYPGATTPARPGEVVILWGTGFGATTPDIPAGEVVSVPARLAATPVVTIGGVTADVLYAGLSGSGLYQINIKVPEGVSDGDQPVVVQIEGARTQAGAFVTVQRP